MSQIDEAVIKKDISNSLEAEQFVIGSMLLDQEAIGVASEQITGDDFFNKQYGIVFDAIVEMHKEGKPIDIDSLQSHLQEKAASKEICRLEYLQDVLGALPTSANIKYYAGIVAEKSLLRKVNPQ